MEIFLGDLTTSQGSHEGSAKEKLGNLWGIQESRPEQDLCQFKDLGGLIFRGTYLVTVNPAQLILFFF